MTCLRLLRRQHHPQNLPLVYPDGRARNSSLSTGLEAMKNKNILKLHRALVEEGKKHRMAVPSLDQRPKNDQNLDLPVPNGTLIGMADKPMQPPLKQWVHEKDFMLVGN